MFTIVWTRIISVHQLCISVREHAFATSYIRPCLARTEQAEEPTAECLRRPEEHYARSRGGRPWIRCRGVCMNVVGCHAGRGGDGSGGLHVITLAWRVRHLASSRYTRRSCQCATMCCITRSGQGDGTIGSCATTRSTRMGASSVLRRTMTCVRHRAGSSACSILRSARSRWMTTIKRVRSDRFNFGADSSAHALGMDEDNDAYQLDDEDGVHDANTNK